jgi:hypothetical protein
MQHASNGTSQVQDFVHYCNHTLEPPLVQKQKKRGERYTYHIPQPFYAHVTPSIVIFTFFFEAPDGIALLNNRSATDALDVCMAVAQPMPPIS